MGKNAIVKISLPLSDVQRHVGSLVAGNPWAEVVRTGYTVQVNTPGRRYFFADQETKPQTFSVSKRIMGDIGRSGVRVMEGLDPDAVPYYRVPQERKSWPSEAWCIDIKAAYPTTLRLMECISDDTFRDCMTLPKSDRLKSVGMIAATKYHQRFEHAKLVSYTRETTPYRPFFFAACQMVGDTMQKIVSVFHTEADEERSPFLFYWVDGAFLNVKEPDEARSIIEANGYRTTVERVTNIRRSVNGKFIFYRKNGKDTYLCVPRRMEYDDDRLLLDIANATDL